MSIISKKQNNTINLACNISEKLQKQLIKVALSSSLNLNIALSNLNLNEDKNLQDVDIYDLIGLYIKIIKWFVQYNKEEFSDKLLGLGFSGNFVEKFPLKYENKHQIENNMQLSNNIQSLKWRIDISLSNNVLKKKVPPWVIMSLTLQKNQKHILIIDIRTFHKLRYNVVLILKELNNLKKSSLLKK